MGGGGAEASRFFRIMKSSLRLVISIIYDVENYYFYAFYKLSTNFHSAIVPLIQNELNSNP